MTGSEDSHVPEVALIIGGGPGVSASCARLFAREGMKVAVAALFSSVGSELGPPALVVHNIDGRTAAIFRKTIT